MATGISGAAGVGAVLMLGFGSEQKAIWLNLEMPLAGNEAQRNKTAIIKSLLAACNTLVVIGINLTCPEHWVNSFTIRV